MSSIKRRTKLKITDFILSLSWISQLIMIASVKVAVTFVFIGLAFTVTAYDNNKGKKYSHTYSNYSCTLSLCGRPTRLLSTYSFVTIIIVIITCSYLTILSNQSVFSYIYVSLNECFCVCTRRYDFICKWVYCLLYMCLYQCCQVIKYIILYSLNQSWRRISLEIWHFSCIKLVRS